MKSGLLSQGEIKSFYHKNENKKLPFYSTKSKKFIGELL
jgi:hypothetical protein